VNGDAEANGQDAATSAQATSQPKNWSQAGDYSATVIRYGATGGFADQNSPGPSNRGNNFFIGGPQRTYAGATQTIDLSNWGADAFALIDASQVTFQFQGWLGGYAGQDDYAELTAVFQNAGLQSPALGKATLTGPNNAVRQGQTGLVFTSTTGVLSAGTRKIVVYMDFYRAAGSGTYDDGMADNLSFTLKGP
jgi:hypothetical protein